MADEPARHGDLMLMGRFVAATDMLGRAGASEFEVAFDDDTGYERVPVLWWATAKWGGARLDSELFPYPAQAAEDLLARALNGGKCTWCDRTTVVGLVTEATACATTSWWPTTSTTRTATATGGRARRRASRCA